MASSAAGRSASATSASPCCTRTIDFQPPCTGIGFGGAVDARADLLERVDARCRRPASAVTFTNSASSTESRGSSRIVAAHRAPRCRRRRRCSVTARAAGPSDDIGRRPADHGDQHEPAGERGRRSPDASRAPSLAADQRAARPDERAADEAADGAGGHGRDEARDRGLGQQRVVPRNRHPDVRPAPTRRRGRSCRSARPRSRRSATGRAPAGARRRPPRRAAPRRCRAGSAAVVWPQTPPTISARKPRITRKPTTASSAPPRPR